MRLTVKESGELHLSKSASVRIGLTQSDRKVYIKKRTIEGEVRWTIVRVVKWGYGITLVNGSARFCHIWMAKILIALHRRGEFAGELKRHLHLQLEFAGNKRKFLCIKRP